ncbi:MAG: ABC transporter ATP-binding protein [Deltaproteobacteria bacterium]|nr:ABC transporter ATP-binding protein [Deltaproteobacteria bacterium]
MHTTPIIELQDLRVRLGQQEILQGISCCLGVFGTGKAVGLLGPNGAGKSTLILTLLGFHQISAGSARVLGHDCRSHSREIKARIGYMPENEAFIADMTAVHFLRIMGELSGLPQRVALEKAHEVLFHVGLGEARYRTLGTYSLGMKQMAKLAQSILHGPEVLILDEPTNGLDPAARLRMLKLIREMKEEHHMNIVLCSHLLRDVEEVCDEVIILDEGRLVHQANLEEERHTNRRFIELEVTGDDSELADALKEEGAEGVSEGSGRWRIVFPPGMELDVLWQLVARQNLAIHHLTHRRDSLEEIFLKAVGHLDPSEQSTSELTEKETAHDRL